MPSATGWWAAELPSICASFVWSHCSKFVNLYYLLFLVSSDWFGGENLHLCPLPHAFVEKTWPGCPPRRKSNTSKKTLLNIDQLVGCLTINRIAFLRTIKAATALLLLDKQPHLLCELWAICITLNCAVPLTHFSLLKGKPCFCQVIDSVGVVLKAKAANPPSVRLRVFLVDCWVLMVPHANVYYIWRDLFIYFDRMYTLITSHA